jgi:hypothetical protein
MARARERRERDEVTATGDEVTARFGADER